MKRHETLHDVYPCGDVMIDLARRRYRPLAHAHSNLEQQFPAWGVFLGKVAGFRLEFRGHQTQFRGHGGDMVICIEKIGNTAPAGQSRYEWIHIYTSHIDDFHLINTTVLASGIPRFPAKTCDGTRLFAKGTRRAKIEMA